MTNFRLSIIISSLIFIVNTSYAQQKEIVQRLFYEKTPTSWLLRTKEDYHYNASHQLISMMSRDTSDRGWTNRLQKEIRYSPIANSHQRIEIIREAADSTWGDPMHTLILQDPNGHDVMTINTDYDSTETLGILYNIGYFTLDDEGRPTNKRYAQPTEQGLRNQDMTTLIFVGSRLEAEEFATAHVVVEENGSWKNEGWEPQNKTRYFYSPDQTIERTEIYTIDKATQNWMPEPSTLSFFTYDADKHLLEHRIQKKRSGVWTDVFKRVSVWGIPGRN